MNSAAPKTTSEEAARKLAAAQNLLSARLSEADIGFAKQQVVKAKQELQSAQRKFKAAMVALRSVEGKA